MASFLERASINPRIQLAATAIASGAVVASAILGYQRLQRVERVHKLKSSIPSLAAGEALRKVSETRQNYTIIHCNMRDRSTIFDYSAHWLTCAR